MFATHGPAEQPLLEFCTEAFRISTVLPILLCLQQSGHQSLLVVPQYAQVVTKLFHIVEPDVAVFGRKDYQQWRIITRMVRDLDFPIEIVGMPITREPDGLAMSR